jgi:hypothetical protein
MPQLIEVPGQGVVEFPDGMSDEQIGAAIRRASGDARVANLQSNWKKNNPIRQIGEMQRGGIDVIGGGAQLLARGANALGLVPESTGDGFFAGPREVEQQNAQARKNVDAVFGPETKGFSPTRAASSALLTLPMTPARFVQAPTAVGRAMGAGTSGAIVAGMQEVQDPKSNSDFFGRKGIQAGVGFATGAISQPIAEKVVRYVVSGLNKAADKATAITQNLTGANSVQRMETLAREALKKSGMNYDALDDSVKQSLLDDVQKALGSYSGTDPEAIARQAAFRQERFDPLRHWITRDPSEFTTLENLSHQDVGAPLKQRKNALDRHVMDRLVGMRGEQPIPNRVGETAIKDLEGAISQERGKTNVLYDTFRDIAPDVKGDPQRFANRLWDGLEGKFASKSLPDGLRDIVNSISTGETPLTPSVLYQLQKMANGSRGADGSKNYALGHLSRVIDAEMDAISKAIPGGDASRTADVLKMARGQHARTMGEVEGSKILSGVEGKTLSPDNFTDTLLRSPLKEVAATWVKLGEDAKTQVRAQVIDEIKTKAFSGASEASGKSANQQTLNNYLNDAGTRQKLKVILGDKGLEEVKRLALMLESAKLEPSGGAVNHSKTGGALLTSATKLSDLARAKGIWGSQAFHDSAMRGLAQSAQVTPGEALGRQSLVIDPLVEEILKRRAGQGAGLLGSSQTPAALYGLLGLQ